jgi:hypothetical protein
MQGAAVASGTTSGPRHSTAQRDSTSTSGPRRWRYQGAMASSPAQPLCSTRSTCCPRASWPRWCHLQHNNQSADLLYQSNTQLSMRRWRSWARQRPASATHAMMWFHDPHERQHIYMNRASATTTTTTPGITPHTVQSCSTACVLLRCCMTQHCMRAAALLHDAARMAASRLTSAWRHYLAAMHTQEGGQPAHHSKLVNAALKARHCCSCLRATQGPQRIEPDTYSLKVCTGMYSRMCTPAGASSSCCVRQSSAASTGLAGAHASRCAASKLQPPGDMWYGICLMMPVRCWQPDIIDIIRCSMMQRSCGCGSRRQVDLLLCRCKGEKGACMWHGLVATSWGGCKGPNRPNWHTTVNVNAGTSS